MAKLKKGRPRKIGVKRYPSGRVAEATVEDITRTAVEARARHLGIRPNEKGQYSKAAQKYARDADMGSPLGRFKKWGQITLIQHEAGEKFASVIRDYLAISTAPRHTPKCIEAGMVGGGAGSIAALEDDETIRRNIATEARARGLIRALEELDQSVRLVSQRSHSAIVWSVCVSESTDHLSQYELGALREGLNAVARHLERGRP